MKTNRDAYPQGTQQARRADLPGHCPAPAYVEEHPLVLRRGGKRLAVLLASRGLVFSRAMESILRECVNLGGWEVALFQTHGLGIPEAQQDLVTRALAWGAQVTWLVEEDNYMPPGVLKALLKLRLPVAACDYYNHEGSGPVSMRAGKVEFVAFGCTLVRSGVWRLIGPPYVNKGKRLRFAPCGNAEEEDTYHRYGGQDLDFSLRCHRLGVQVGRLSLAEWRVGHLSVTKQGSRGSTNQGFHEIQVS